MRILSFLATLIIVGLTACAQLNPHPMDMTAAIGHAKTARDHNALARHYEDAAQEMRMKVEEHKKALEEYERHPYYYSKRAQDLKAHCARLINSYEQAAETNRKMAEIHRQLAAETK